MGRCSSFIYIYTDAIIHHFGLQPQTADEDSALLRISMLTRNQYPLPFKHLKIMQQIERNGISSPKQKGVNDCLCFLIV
jgi:hypothetical protein